MKFWASTAFTEISQYVHLARYCDEAGVHGLMMSDHQVYPKVLQKPYPYSPYPDGRPIWEPETPWPDVWVTIGAMAAVTERIHFGTSIYVAPARNLLTVAKAVGTAAALSDNRVHLGLGAGWMKEEFDLQGIDYASRGKLLDEMIPALRTLWSGGWVEHHGTFFDFGPLMIEPHPTKQVPIWNGGHTDAALRRAARLCDGWVGNAYSEEDADKYLSKLQAMLAAEGRANDPFEVIIGLYAEPTVDLCRKWEDKGVTGLLCVPWMSMEADGFNNNVAEVQNTTALSRKRDAIMRFGENVVAKIQS
jgi:probable F420-dependent oxidoreductase